MTNAAKKSEHLEILISTMRKTTLSFLSEMFSQSNYLDSNILIINQTNEGELLVSDFENIRVINSCEKGLPQSRNIALENASGAICLIADDDIKYVKNFNKIILTAFNKHPNADIITFQMNNDEGQLFRDYQDIIKHNKDTIYTANSVVIAFRLKSIKEHVSFNPYFGLGAKFQVGDEYVFLRNSLKAGLSIYFESKVILTHSKLSSGQDVSSDRLIYGRSALYYKYFGLRSYFRIGKHIYRTFACGKLSLSEIIPKFRVGLKGIKDYQKLLKEGSETR
jgi:glycosyltransferase involved in cell wall biosynthesis